MAISNKEYLERLVKRNEVPSSLLFAGPKNSEKEELAESFSKLLVASDLHSHPDIHRYRPEGKIGMHGVESIRHLKEEAYLPPYQSLKKVFLIFDAERMLPYSANALLKIFEEPPLYNTIILISSYPEKILPTIISRCHTIRFKGDAENKIKINPSLLNILIQYKSLSYPDLLKRIKQLILEIEPQFEVSEETKDLTAFQVQQLEKQKEGSFALAMQFAAETLFEQILAWFRDIILLQFNGPSHLLYHVNHLQEVKQACARGGFVPLEKLQEAVCEARTSLERSTPLQNVLEYFFLTLSKIGN